MSAENSEKKSLGGQGSAPNPAGELDSAPDLLAGGAYCPSPRIPPRSRLSASIFGPTTLIRQPLPTVFISPAQCIWVLIKTLVVPIFGAKECIRMQDFVLKNIQKFPGVATPGPHSGRGDICSYPPLCPPARCWCPSASSGLATALL